MFSSNKHSNLLGLFISFDENEVLWIRTQEDSRCKAEILKIENKYVREVEREYQHQLNLLSEDLLNENNFNREGSMS